MPELPEVETFARDLDAVCRGRTITDLWIARPDYCRPSPEALGILEGAEITQVRRRAKTVIIETDRGIALALAPRMSGAPLLGRPEASPRPPDRHAHLGWALRDAAGRLQARIAWRDPRRFGNATLLEIHGDPDAPIDSPGRYHRIGGTPHFAGVGPEPLAPGLSARTFAARLRQADRRAPKAALLDQRLVCGVGNIYADEACFAAGVHPATPLGALDDPTLLRLTRAAIRIMREAVRRRGSRVHSYRAPSGEAGMAGRLRAYGRAGLPCQRCAGLMQGARIAGRSTSFCPACQPLLRLPPALG